MMASPSLLPLVGIPACLKQLERFRGHAVNERYVNVIAGTLGALPVLLPAIGEHADVDELARRLDGILFTGSPSNVEPHHYGGEPSVEGTLHDPARDATTLPLIRSALRQGVPFLCICRGIQELNVALGGTLHQRVQELPGKRDHRSPRDVPTFEDKYREAHTVSLPPGGYLHALFGGRDEIRVNSLHAQGIDRLAQGLVVEAVAPDGLIEAVRVESASTFAVGVQWHPEHPIALEWESSRALFDAFGSAVRARANARAAVHRTEVLAHAAQ